MGRLCYTLQSDAAIPKPRTISAQHCRRYDYDNFGNGAACRNVVGENFSITKDSKVPKPNPSPNRNVNDSNPTQLTPNLLTLTI